MHVDHKSKYLDNASDKAPTILVLGVDGASIEPLNVWLGENIQLSSLNGSESSKRYMRFDHSQMAFELGGLSYPVKYNEAVEFFAFELNETTSIDSIAKIVFDDPRNEAPIFIHKKKRK